MRALRRDRVETEDDFPRELAELQQLLGEPQPGQQVVAVPGAGTRVPIWLLGSSLFSAQLAAERGLPYAFASHFAPCLLHQALDLYRSRFRPSATLARPYAIIGVPPMVAAGLAQLQQATAADELMLVCDIFDPALRLNSLDIAAAACGMSPALN